MLTTILSPQVRLAEAEPLGQAADGGESGGARPPTPQEVLERLQLSLVIMQRSLFQFGGSISRLQIDDKGTSFSSFRYQDYHVLF